MVIIRFLWHNDSAEYSIHKLIKTHQENTFINSSQDKEKFIWGTIDGRGEEEVLFSGVQLAVPGVAKHDPEHTRPKQNHGQDKTDHFQLLLPTLDSPGMKSGLLQEVS